jgi:hypothetical protein
LAEASDVMIEHPVALQLRTLQTMAEISVDKNSTVLFPAPILSTIQELGTFLSEAIGKDSSNGSNGAKPEKPPLRSAG